MFWAVNFFDRLDQGNLESLRRKIKRSMADSISSLREYVSPLSTLFVVNIRLPLKVD